MASEHHASYAKIGLSIVLGLVAIVATLIYLGGIWDSGDELFVETCYDRPVSGLSVGSPVNFRGVHIGEVREIGFIGEKYDVADRDCTRIYILMALKSVKLLPKARKDHSFFYAKVRTHVEKYGLRVTVTSNGITGLSRMEFDYNLENPSPPPTISWTPQHAYVPSRMSLLEDFSVAATKVMNQINHMDLNATWSNVNAMVQSLAMASDGARAMIETRQADIERLLDNLSSTSAAVRELADELRRNPSLLIRERTPNRLEETE